MYTIFSNVHDVFQCLKQTSVFNRYNLDGKIFIFKFKNLTTLIFVFGFKVFHERCFVIVVDGCMCG
jgi:hypothetical protein